MKKTIFTCILCLSLGFTGNVQINASENTKANSDVSVTFTENTDPIDPVDPEEPEKPGPGPSPNGPLAIVSVSDFNFGSGKIKAETDFRKIVTERPNLQVGDLRGAFTGWKVSAQISAFKDEDDNTSLAGTKLHIYNARMNSTSSMVNAPTPHLDVVLEPNKPDYVVTAEQGKGGGVWVARWYPLNAEDDPFIELEIPPGVSAAGSHSATIAWSLQDTP